MDRRVLAVGTMLTVMAMAACSENQAGRLSLAVSSRSAPAALPSAPAFPAPSGAPMVSAAGDSTILVMGNDSVIVRSVEVVVRAVELKRVEATACDAVMGNGDCQVFEAGPAIVSLPLGAAVTTPVIAVAAPAGMYDELKFQIHKPESSNDAAFIAANPDFNGIAIRVTGTYSQAGARSDFVYTSELTGEHKAVLTTPLTVVEGMPTNLTLRFDISTWFVNADGTALVDPASANKGQVNESVVKDHIQASIDAFRDDNRDGRDDDNEPV